MQIGGRFFISENRRIDAKIRVVIEVIRNTNRIDKADYVALE